MKKILIFIICTIFSIGAFSKENKVVNGVETVYDDTKGTIETVYNDTKSVVTTIYDDMKGVASEIYPDVKNALSESDSDTKSMELEDVTISGRGSYFSSDFLFNKVFGLFPTAKRVNRVNKFLGLI